MRQEVLRWICDSPRMWLSHESCHASWSGLPERPPLDSRAGAKSLRFSQHHNLSSQGVVWFLKNNALEKDTVKKTVPFEQSDHRESSTLLLENTHIHSTTTHSNPISVTSFPNPKWTLWLSMPPFSLNFYQVITTQSPTAYKVYPPSFF